MARSWLRCGAAAAAVCGAVLGPAVAPAAGGTVPATRIVGGTDADVREVPWQVSLRSAGGHICGASIIRADAVVTAAHCTAEAPPGALSVQAGSSVRGSGGQVVRVARVLRHPRFDAATIDYDVAVLVLASPLDFGPGVRAIGLVEPGREPAEGTPATVTGWGATRDGGDLPVRLRQVAVPKLSDAYCKGAYGPSSITPRMTCYGYEAGRKDACQGDSGGPLVVGGRLAGIASWGTGCASPGHPGVYTKVSDPAIHAYIARS
ncbi:serine protease [Streptomyces sp. RS10V-4]|uniref:serine protease n=1 Tax=Streptomyces rhizoryzae TaxID=2932493 RepID=UPI002002F789|nr:serine protease [Streptomyces rhizoryzae]MCK7625000.1 serine protease [Streptomyces rhizoryzae]